eukprot:TRINITY_DN12313_c0_g1_i1.p1 TRINITY_DN12313_c0_g1~~TRINITY_DN12313_c0_g1_i1.p1  ORF type:complete len:753 (+),score=287.63 TRINITY_DN12313_c0_g1_i1:109-2367(+)
MRLGVVCALGCAAVASAKYHDGCARMKDGDYVYEWCAGKDMWQHHQHIQRMVGTFQRRDGDSEVFHMGFPCGQGKRRRGRAKVVCCRRDAPPAASAYDAVDAAGRWLKVPVEEPVECDYHVTVCDPAKCGDTIEATTPHARPRASNVLPAEERAALREKVVDMFDFAFGKYLEEAFPEPEVRPVSCTGGGFGFVQIPGLTLIDALGTLAVMGKTEEFQRSVDELLKVLPPEKGFDYDITVSLFETTIRVLGGLLSAHVIAESDAFNVTTPLSQASLERYAARQKAEHTAKYPYAPPLQTTVLDWEYDGGLLTLALDLAERLSQAFPEGLDMVPYGAVNLRSGVPKGETTVSSLAGAGSLSVEFTVASLLSGNPKYARLGVGAAVALYRMRSELNLVGKHIDMTSYHWSESGSGLGTNSDSFYEYLLKTHLLTGNDALWEMFETSYEALMAFVKDGRVYADVLMFTGHLQNTKLEGLAAFWPGVQSLIGDFGPATQSLNAMMRIWRDVLFLPEGFDYRARGFGANKQDASYLLRPELIESLMYMVTATHDVSWATPVKGIIHAIETYCKAECGYTSISGLQHKDGDDPAHADPDHPGWTFKHPRQKMPQADNTPSYFLSETLKYLYLVLHESLEPGTHWMLDPGTSWVLSTEAHPFPVHAMRARITDEIAAVLPKAHHSLSRAAPEKMCPVEDVWAESYDPHYQPPAAWKKDMATELQEERQKNGPLSKQQLKDLVKYYESIDVNRADTKLFG